MAASEKLIYDPPNYKFLQIWIFKTQKYLPDFYDKIVALIARMLETLACW